MAFRRGVFRGDKRKLFTGIMCIGFGLFFFANGFIHGFTTSKIVFGGLLLYFGIRSLSLARG